MNAEPQKTAASPRPEDVAAVSDRGWFARLLALLPGMGGWAKGSRRRRRRVRVHVVYR